MLLGRPCSHSLKVAKRLRRRVATFIGMTSVEKKDINVAVVLRTSRYASVHTPFDGDVMMIPLLFLLAFASTMPSTNLNSTCQSAKAAALPGQDEQGAFESCLHDESAARDEL
jgi:hypothetical protein